MGAHDFPRVQPIVNSRHALVNIDVAENDERQALPFCHDDGHHLAVNLTVIDNRKSRLPRHFSAPSRR